jgi:putative flippase GtrA
MEIKQLKKEIKRFIIAGVFAVGTDLIIYYVLLNFLPYFLAKGISFVFGSFVAFIINKFWTFKKNRKSFKEVLQFTFLYFSTLMLNIFVNNFMLNIDDDAILLSFVLATSCSTILNFIGQKWWVFKSQNIH